MAVEREVGGMRCGEVLAELSDYLDGELGEARRAQVEAHLHGCDVCERFGSSFSGIIHALRQSDLAPTAEEPAVYERLRARLEQAGKEQSRTT
jgi:anti-sigma factor RsiW